MDREIPADELAEAERVLRSTDDWFYPDVINAVMTLMPEYDERGRELERLHTWAGLMSLLDEHYPADIMTGESGDPGPRIVALARALDRLRAEQHEMICPSCQATIRSRLVDTADRAELTRLRKANAQLAHDLAASVQAKAGYSRMLRGMARKARRYAEEVR